jgi:hypothetical protein
LHSCNIYSSVCLPTYILNCLLTCLCHLSTCHSTCLFACLSVCLSVCLSIFLSICLSACFCLYLSFCPSVCLSVCLSVYLAMYLRIYLPSIVASPFVLPSVYSYICLTTYPFIYPPISQFIHISARLSLPKYLYHPPPTDSNPSHCPPSLRQYRPMRAIGSHFRVYISCLLKSGRIVRGKSPSQDSYLHKTSQARDKTYFEATIRIRYHIPAFQQ